MLRLKFFKFLISFLKAPVSFPSNIASIFSAIKQNSPILYLAQRSCTLTKRSPLKRKFLVVRSKFIKFLMSFLKAQASFPSNVASLISAIKQNSPILFFSWKIMYFIQKKPIKMQIFEIFSSACVKIRQIPHVIFESTSQFSFKCCINI